jgi:hypothetical protein
MTRLGFGGSVSLLACVLCLAQASIGFLRGIKAVGTWLSSGSVIAIRTMPFGGPRPALCKDAGVMVISDPS